MRRGILADINELMLLRNRIGTRPFDEIYSALRKRCGMILESSPVTEQQWRSLWEQGGWGSALNAARTTQGRLMDLAIAHHIDANPAYRSRAIEELKNLAGWSTWVDPCHPNQLVDLCTAEAAVGAVIGLDWLWEDLVETDRLRVLHAVRNKALAPYRQAVAQGAWWYSVYHNWNAVVNGGLGLAALALSDDEPSAREAVHLAKAGLRHFFEALGREGGWDEGLGYWGYAMRYLLMFGEGLSRLEDDHSVLHARGMDATSLFPIYFTPNGQAASFGDAPSVPAYGALYLLVKHHGVKELTWWLDTYAFHRDASSSGWSTAGLALLLRPVDAEVPAVPDLSTLKVFNEIGWVAMADQWPRPRFYAAAKAGDLGANHSQHDMNSLQLQVDGEMLLCDLGAAPYTAEYFSRSRGEFYEVQARAHNTLTVGGRDHGIDAQGSIIDALEDKTFRWAACDGGQACGENVQFIRHVVMLMDVERRIGKTLVVLDELSGRPAERVDVYWHTQGQIILDPPAMGGRIVGRQAAVNFRLFSTAKAVATMEVHPLRPNLNDYVLHASAPAAGKSLFVSIFSREKIADKIDFKQSAGEVRLTFGRNMLHFKSVRKHLRLKDVSLD